MQTLHIVKNMLSGITEEEDDPPGQGNDSRCVAGAFAKLALLQIGVDVRAYTSQVGEIKLPEDYTHYDLNIAEQNPVRCPDTEIAKKMIEYISYIKGEGDTVGGVITGVIRNVPGRIGRSCIQ